MTSNIRNEQLQIEQKPSYWHSLKTFDHLEIECTIVDKTFSFQFAIISGFVPHHFSVSVQQTLLGHIAKLNDILVYYMRVVF